MRPDLGTVPIPSQADPVGDVVRIVVNHESSVTDVEGNTWLPYPLQGADGVIRRLGMVRREALGYCHNGGDAASGTTCHDLSATRQPTRKQRDIGVQPRDC